jgi:serine protease Do
MAGEVIGITSLKVSQVGVEGMGYAININQAMPIIKRITPDYVLVMSSLRLTVISRVTLVL